MNMELPHSGSLTSASASRHVFSVWRVRWKEKEEEKELEKTRGGTHGHCWASHYARPKMASRWCWVERNKKWRMSQLSASEDGMVHAKASKLQVPSRPFYSALSATQKPKRFRGVFVTTGVDSSSFHFCLCVYTNAMNWQPRSKYAKSKNASHVIDWQIKLSNWHHERVLPTRF